MKGGLYILFSLLTGNINDTVVTVKTVRIKVLILFILTKESAINI